MRLTVIISLAAVVPAVALRQRFADGMVTDWTTPNGTTRPTAVTQLTLSAPAATR